MRLCLSCRFVSPADALFCGRCGRSFGGRLCPRHHRSPAGSKFCVHCGRQELTQATLHLPLGWLSRLTAWGCVLLALSLLAHHFGSLAWSAVCLANWTLIHVLNLCPCAVWKGAVLGSQWLLALFLVSWLLPGSTGQRLRTGLRHALHWTFRAGKRLALGFGRGMLRLAEGAPSKTETKDKKKKH